MILVISGTNRPGSKTKIVADEVYNYLSENSGDEVRFLDLQDLPNETLALDMYNPESMHKNLVRIQDELIIPADRWVIVSPEYNGSFPGVLKLLIDAISVRRAKETFSFKKAALIGVASGRAGNFRGMEHLTGLLNYMKLTIYYDKLPLSSISSLIEVGKLKPETNNILHTYLENYIKWLD